jgi:hypothetical protein
MKVLNNKERIHFTLLTAAVAQVEPSDSSEKQTDDMEMSVLQGC